MKTNKFLNLTVLAVMAIMISTPVWAQGDVGAGHGKHGKKGKFLQKLDTNGDKSVSLEEMVSGVEDRFDKLDQNGDGIITKVEFVFGIEDKFSKMDKNSDGLINKDDFAEMRKKIKENRGKNFAPEED